MKETHCECTQRIIIELSDGDEDTPFGGIPPAQDNMPDDVELGEEVDDAGNRGLSAAHVGNVKQETDHQPSASNKRPRAPRAPRSSYPPHIVDRLLSRYNTTRRSSTPDQPTLSNTSVTPNHTLMATSLLKQLYERTLPAPKRHKPGQLASRLLPRSASPRELLNDEDDFGDDVHGMGVGDDTPVSQPSPMEQSPVEQSPVEQSPMEQSPVEQLPDDTHDTHSGAEDIEEEATPAADTNVVPNHTPHVLAPPTTIWIRGAPTTTQHQPSAPASAPPRVATAPSRVTAPATCIVRTIHATKTTLLRRTASLGSACSTDGARDNSIAPHENTTDVYNDTRGVDGARGVDTVGIQSPHMVAVTSTPQQHTEQPASGVALPVVATDVSPQEDRGVDNDNDMNNNDDDNDDHNDNNDDNTTKNNNASSAGSPELGVPPSTTQPPSQPPSQQPQSHGSGNKQGPSGAHHPPAGTVTEARGGCPGQWLPQGRLRGGNMRYETIPCFPVDSLEGPFWPADRLETTPPDNAPLPFQDSERKLGSVFCPDTVAAWRAHTKEARAKNIVYTMRSHLGFSQQGRLSCRLLDKEELIQQMTTVYGLTNEYIVNCIHKMEIKLHHQLVKQARKENIVFKDEILNASSLPEGLPCSSAVEARRITPGSASALLRPGTVGQMGLFAREHIRPFTILGSYQGLVTTERNFVALWEKGVPGRVSPWDLKLSCEEYALTIGSTDGGNEPGVAPDSKLAHMPKSLQKLCGSTGNLSVIAFGFGNQMAYANDFRSEPPHRLLHRPRTTMPAHAPAHSTPAGRGGGSAGQQRANARGGGQQALTHANCQYVEFGVLDWPFVFVITTPTLNQDGTVNYEGVLPGEELLVDYGAGFWESVASARHERNLVLNLWNAQG